MNQPIAVAIAGLGSRGRNTYGDFALSIPDEMRVVAVVDIDPKRVAEAARTFSIPPDCCFANAEAFFAQERLADILFICTPDRHHVEYAIPALEKGYHLLLEKPIAPTVEDCRRVLAAAQKAHRIVTVCHVLRYTTFFRAIKSYIDAGAVGEVVSIQAIENVGYYHQAHSFVRGNWGNSALSSSMILQKCSHDLDILPWLCGSHIDKVSSFGELMLFRPERAPQGAAMRCLDGCAAKADCPFDAEKIYITDSLTGIRHGKSGWPNNIVSPNPTEETLYDALRTGPYGRCVYHCDNDVVDHQVVNMEMENGATISLTMCGLTSSQYRFVKIMGTKGDIEGDMGQNTIKVTAFGQEPRIIDVNALSDDFSGHGGGDIQMVKELLTLVRENADPNSTLSSISRSMESHYAAFAAEISREAEGLPVKIKQSLQKDAGTQWHHS